MPKQMDGRMDRRMEGQKEGRTEDGRMERPYFIGPFRLPPGVQKLLKFVFFTTHFCQGETDKVSDTSFMLFSV